MKESFSFFFIFLKYFQISQAALLSIARSQVAWGNWQNCPELDEPKNGEIECRGRACKLTCEPGSVLKGKKAVGCALNEETGDYEWRKPIGKCISCPDFPRSKIPEGVEVEYGVNEKGVKQANFSCANGDIETNFGEFESFRASCRCNKK